MNFYQIACLFGFPSLFMASVGVFHRRMQEVRQESKALRVGVQALLRAQMISDYNKWSEKGYAPIYARENFENIWNQYHSLGENGVMDDIHEKFMALPIPTN